MTPDPFFTLRTLICDIALIADEHKTYPDPPIETAFNAIAAAAEQSRSLIIQLQRSQPNTGPPPPG